MGNPLAIIEGIDANKLLALINRLGGRENVDAILAGDKRVTFEDVVRVVIGKNARFVIPEGFGFGHIDLNPNYRWDQPVAEFDYGHLVTRGALFLPRGMKLPLASQMEDGCRALEERIMADQQVSNLFTVKDRHRGIRLPWFLPQMEIDPKNVGRVIQQVFMPAIKAAYENNFNERKFVDYCGNDTYRQVTIVDEGQLRLIDALREGPVFGWIFPAIFQGIGIDGTRALMKTLPAKHRFALGGFDILMAMILHTSTLAYDLYTPAMDFASFQLRDPDRSFHLNAFSAELAFVYKDLKPHADSSAALSVFTR